MSRPIRIRYRKCSNCVRMSLHETYIAKFLNVPESTAHEYCFWCRLKTLKYELLLCLFTYPLNIFLILHSTNSAMQAALYLSLAVYQIKCLDVLRALIFGHKYTTFHLTLPTNIP